MRECYKVRIWGENWDNSSSSSPEAVPISWIKAQMSVLSPSYLGLPPSSCIIIVIPFDQMSVCWREEGRGRITLVPIFSGNSQNLPTSRIRNSFCCCYCCFLSQKSEPSDWSRALNAVFSLVENFFTWSAKDEVERPGCSPKRSWAPRDFQL